MKRKGINFPVMFFVALLLSVIPLFDLFHQGLPVTHDGQDHVARIANFYASLSQGNIIPRWASQLNWGYGHPILMFLYPLPSYVASAFHAVGFSFVESTKLVFAVAFISSMLAMYLWISDGWGKLPGITAAILYGFAPYRFVDLYVRGAIGEHMAFVFPPLICLGLLRLSREKNHINPYTLLIISLSTAMLILSHNALSLMFLPIIGLYGLYLATHEKKKPMRFIVWSIALIASGFFLSAYYWIPALFEGKYTLRDIVTSGEFSGRFVPWLSFFYSPWSYGGGNELSKWLGIGQIVVIVISLFILKRKTKQHRLISGSILLLFISLFLMTKNSQLIWNTVTLLQKFQFPWRIMSVTVFLVSFLGALVVHLTPEKNRVRMALVLGLVTILTTIPMWKAKAYKQYQESFFTGIYNGTTDTGESSPIWSVRFMEKRPETFAYLMPPGGVIVPGVRSSTLRTYHAVITEPSRFVENTLYFPGWQVFINEQPIAMTKLLFQDPAYRGLMTFDLSPGEYDIRFVFRDTKLRMMSNYISFASLALFLIGLGTIQLLWHKKI